MRARPVWLATALLLASWVIAACSAAAPKVTYPEKPINIVIGFPAGSATDLVTRALVEGTKSFLSQPITIINRSGGGGTPGVAEVIQAKADGYTLGSTGAGPILAMPHLTDLPYKGPDQYVSIFSMAKSLSVVAVPANAPWKTLKEFVDYAKANPGKIRVGVAGIGSVQHLNLEALKEKAGFNVTHVPVAGEGENMTAILGGHLEAALSQSHVAHQHVQAGTVRLLATFQETRAMYPEVPTLRELGYDLTVSTYFFVFAPKGTPDPVVQALNDALRKGYESDIFKKYVRDNNMVSDGVGMDELRKRVERDYVFYGDMVTKLGLKGKV